MYMTTRARMSFIMELIGPELSELSALDQSAPNLVKMYMTIRSRMRSIMDLIGPELSELSALELENFPYLTLFTL